MHLLTLGMKQKEAQRGQPAQLGSEPAWQQQTEGLQLTGFLQENAQRCTWEP